MNAAVRAFVRTALYHRCKVFGIYNSFQGLAEGKIQVLDWGTVAGWGRRGGSKLGTQKQLPTNYMEKSAVQFKKFGIQALLIIGGFEVYYYYFNVKLFFRLIILL
jgi:6-phosphofructokinase 1